MENTNNNVLESAMVEGGEKEARLGLLIVMHAKVRIGTQWYKVDFPTLLSMS